METIETWKPRKTRGPDPGGITIPVARGPLTDLHRRAGATLAIVNGWETATRYPHEPPADANALIDLSHWPTFEVNGPDTPAALQKLSAADVPLRRVSQKDRLMIYRLTDRRAIIFDMSLPSGGLNPPGAARAEARGSLTTAIDVTGGWASIALLGPDRLQILNKITALDLREATLPVGGCCQGPIFGVNTLFGRFEDRFDLHVCTDSAEFLWEVLLDAGHEFALHPAGVEYLEQVRH